ncbi:unnamed protein product [Caenorhabditis angaria]|uniref:EGF-like domain-containing protein n=1 Tax=Caenorhabditis angaria TaxID=860376 RepID=A0A9P1IAL4_9PELO|nr:unnamed protein product [Caenorhabditis angaria]
MFFLLQSKAKKGFGFDRMTNCPPHWSGAACDWPICQNGRADPSTKTCTCRNYYSPPFCISCLPGYWGESCDRIPLKRINPTSDFPIAIPPVLLKPILGLILFLIVFLIVVGIHRLRVHFRNRHPPRYDDIAKDLPPPYAT